MTQSNLRNYDAVRIIFKIIALKIHSRCAVRHLLKKRLYVVDVLDMAQNTAC